MTTKKLSIIAILLMLISCNNSSSTQTQTTEKDEPKTEKTLGNLSTEYETESLIIRKISSRVYEHTTFLDTKDFGKVPCNGMIVVDNNQAVVFDTPTNNENSEELINYLTKKLQVEIIAVVSTHFHADCLGGLEVFHELNIPSYANDQTISLAKAIKSVEPQNGFTNQLVLPVGNKEIYAAFLGEGHTKDNIVGYFPDDKILFGGCLIKEMSAGKGNLEDANINAWSETVRKVKLNYPETEIVIPGHGELGGTELLDYTINLFE